MRGGFDVGALVGFARGRRDLFETFPLTGPHPFVTDPRERCGPLVFTGGGVRVKEIPTARPSAVTLTPDPCEEFIDKTARARVAALLEASVGAGPRTGAARLCSELEAWRLALASPAALARSRYGLASALATFTNAPTPGTKVTWTRDRVVSSCAAGEQVLVFSDFLGALDVLCAELERDGVPHVTLSSAASTLAREVAMADFAAGRLPVLLVAATGQLSANLQAAGRVIPLDVPSTAATLTQRSACAARIGSVLSRVPVDVPVLNGCGDAALLDRVVAAAPLGDLWDLAADLLEGTCRDGVG